VKNYRLTIAVFLAIIVLSIGDSSMKVKKVFIKTRRSETHVTSEAYQYGGADHGDAIGVQVSVFREPHALGASIASPAREARHGLMVKLCNMGIIPVTQLEGLVLCFPDGNGGIEMIEECA
jgi:hypothetical protein